MHNEKLYDKKFDIGLVQLGVERPLHEHTLEHMCNCCQNDCWEKRNFKSDTILLFNGNYAFFCPTPGGLRKIIVEVIVTEECRCYFLPITMNYYSVEEFNIKEFFESLGLIYL